MQLIVTSKLLNKRSAIPDKFSDKSSVVGTVKQGVSFEAEEVTGANLALGKWYKDRDNHYYWGGGVVEKITLTKQLPPTTQYEWWIKDFNIPEFWSVTKGEDMTIALLDTGISRHTDLNQNNIIGGYNFVDNNDQYFSNDTGHCTHMAGIIAGQGKMVQGVAPDIKLWIGKILNSNGQFSRLDFSIITKALQYIIDHNLRFDVINMSIQVDPADLPNDNLKKEIEALVAKIKLKYNTFFVSASGDYGVYVPDIVNPLPANVNGVIAIAGIGTDFKRAAVSGYSDFITIAAPGQDIVSLFPPDITKNWAGTSQSAAYTSGIIALSKNYWLKNKPNVTFSQSDLTGIITQSASPTGNSKESGFGIIQPSKIKSLIDIL